MLPEQHHRLAINASEEG
ncbi:hypothetical protein [Yersinia rohdei]|nr:hypothetical protein [Yersinia rohdei]MDN0094096.1 hypothetical protein [Yersinia rohdei]